MRIAIDARLTYYTSGGISKYIRRLAADLPRLDPGRRYTVLHRRGHRERLSEVAGRLDCWTPAHHRLERTALGIELLPHRFDLLHSPDFIPPHFGYRRSIITVHDLTFWLYPEFLTPDSRRYYNDQIRSAVQRADHISADSCSTRDDLIRLLQVPGDKITVVRLGVDEDFVPLPPEQVTSVLKRYSLLPGYLLFVGTFEPRKNVPGLLIAYARLRERCPDLPPLVLVGRRGWLFDSVRSKIEVLKLTDCVRQIEELPAADLPAFYNGAGALVLPSHYEGFGFPVLEAMACGAPVVIADRASLPELAGDAALKVDPDNPDSIADALYSALTDTALRADLRAEGFEQAKRFRWEDTLRQTLNLYRNVLQQ